MPTRKKFRPTRKNFRRKRRSIRGGMVIDAVSAASRVGASKVGEFVAATGKSASKVGEFVAAKGKSASNALGKVVTSSGKYNNKLKYCEDLETGRMVSKGGNIYFITEIGMANNNSDISYINITDGKNTSVINEINEISEIKAYNYGDILGKIEILSDIILNDKYLIAKEIKNQNKYIKIINNIESIMKKINELDTYSFERNSVVLYKGEACINNPRIIGRLVKYKNNFYYVSDVFDNGDLIIKNKDNEHNINEINEIEPYNYDEVIIRLLSLFKIILEKKYLYKNNTKHNMDKMDIIQEIIKFLKLIKNPEQGSEEEAAATAAAETPRSTHDS